MHLWLARPPKSNVLNFTDWRCVGYLELSKMLQTAYSFTQALLCRIDLKPDFETFVNDQEEFSVTTQLVLIWMVTFCCAIGPKPLEAHTTVHFRNSLHLVFEGLPGWGFLNM